MFGKVRLNQKKASKAAAEKRSEEMHSRLRLLKGVLIEEFGEVPPSGNGIGPKFLAELLQKESYADIRKKYEGKDLQGLLHSDLKRLRKMS